MIPPFLYKEPTIRALVDLIEGKYQEFENEINIGFKGSTYLRWAEDEHMKQWQDLYGLKPETNATIDNIKALIRTKNMATQQITVDLLKDIARLYTNNEIEVYHSGTLNGMIDYIFVGDRKVVLMSGAVDTTQFSGRIVNTYLASKDTNYVWHWQVYNDGTSNLVRLTNTGQKTKRVILRETTTPYEITVVENGSEGTLNAGTIPFVSVPANTIKIKFVGQYGVPDNVNNFKSLLREIIPAHLDIVYEYLYASWQQVDDKNLTWQQVDAKNLTWKQVDEGGLIQ